MLENEKDITKKREKKRRKNLTESPFMLIYIDALY